MLLAEVYERAGVTARRINPPFYVPDWHLHRDAERYMEGLLRYARPIDAPEPGDIALFRFGRTYSHGAIVTEWPRLIHAYWSIGVVWGDATLFPLDGRAVRFFTPFGAETMPDLIAGKGGGPSPFVNAFRAPQLNSLRYNTSQFGSPVFIAYGTCRVSVNVIEYWGFSGSSGGGKGGKGLGSSAGKKGSNQRYQVNVAFGLVPGPGVVHRRLARLRRQQPDLVEWRDRHRARHRRAQRLCRQ